MQTTERKHQPMNLAALVKLAYSFVAGATIVNFVSHMLGGSTLASATAEASIGLLYGVAALIVIFGLVVVGSSLRTPVPQRERRQQ
jgi:cytochrome c biogenesis protein CcdA